MLLLVVVHFTLGVAPLLKTEFDTTSTILVYCASSSAHNGLSLPYPGVFLCRLGTTSTSIGVAVGFVKKEVCLSEQEPSRSYGLTQFSSTFPSAAALVIFRNISATEIR